MDDAFMQKENKMGTMPVGRLIITMSLPMIISMLVQALYNIVDSVFVSRISEQALTAVSLAFPAQNLMIGVATGTGVGVNALLSRALGEKNGERANKVAENGVLLALVGYAIFLVFGLFFSRTFMASQTKIPEIIDMGTVYLNIVCCVSFGLFGEIMFERLMQSTGRTIYTMFTQGVGAIFNIIFDPICIFVFDWGVAGAAAATVAGQIVAFIMAVMLNHRFNADVKLNMRGFKPDFKMIGEIYAIGVPSIIMVCIGSVMTFCMNKILIAYTAGKETAATVFGVYFKLNSFIFMPVFGLNNGTVPIVAYNFGARRGDRMRQTIKYSICAAVAIMIVGMLMFQSIPDKLLRLFDASEEMLRLGVPALRIISISFPLAGFGIGAGSVFQALGYSVYSMIISLIRQLVVLIPCAYAIGWVTGDVTGVWWAFVIAEMVSLIASALYLRRVNRDVIRTL